MSSFRPPMANVGLLLALIGLVAAFSFSLHGGTAQISAPGGRTVPQAYWDLRVGLAFSPLLLIEHDVPLPDGGFRSSTQLNLCSWSGGLLVLSVVLLGAYPRLRRGGASGGSEQGS